MNKIFLMLAVCVTVATGHAFCVAQPQGKIIEKILDNKNGKCDEIVATGFIDLDESGYFLNIAESSERIYFLSDSKDIAKKHKDKAFVRVAAIINQEDDETYTTENWGLMRLDQKEG